MYNLNVSMSAPPLLGVGPSACTTPRTPEILNSVIAMTNPIEIYQQHQQHLQTASLVNSLQAISAGQQHQQVQTQNQGFMSENQLPQITAKVSDGFLCVCYIPSRVLEEDENRGRGGT